MCVFFFQEEDGIRDLVRCRGLGDVYKRQVQEPASPPYEWLSGQVLLPTGGFPHQHQPGRGGAGSGDGASSALPEGAEAAGGDCIFEKAEVFTVHQEEVFVFWH